MDCSQVMAVSLLLFSLFHKYADMFDVSLDCTFGRTEAPQGKQYDYHPVLPPDKEEMCRFVEMCFQPGTLANAKLKESIYRIMEEKE